MNPLRLLLCDEVMSYGLQWVANDPMMTRLMLMERGAPIMRPCFRPQFGNPCCPSNAWSVMEREGCRGKSFSTEARG